MIIVCMWVMMTTMVMMMTENDRIISCRVYRLIWIEPRSKKSGHFIRGYNFITVYACYKEDNGHTNMSDARKDGSLGCARPGTRPRAKAACSLVDHRSRHRKLRIKTFVVWTHSFYLFFPRAQESSIFCLFV
jgi:hypothetical protein